MQRDEYLALAKQRALAYLDRGDLPNALTSMESDLAKHPDLKHINAQIGSLGLIYVLNADSGSMRRWIEGFN